MVSDKRQHQGIGTKLMEALMDVARSNGIKTIQGDVLSENHSMLQLMRSLGFSMTPSPEDGSLYRVERDLQHQ